MSRPVRLAVCGAVVLQTLSLASCFLSTPSQFLPNRATTALVSTEPAGICCPGPCRRIPSWSMALASAKKSKKSALQKALQKPSGALTVSVQYKQQSDKTQLERQILSCQLRKEKVASLWVDKTSLRDFSSEQRGAKGDFPGPCPVILRDAVTTDDDVSFAKEAGASAVVIAAKLENAAELAVGAEKASLTTVWEVDCKDHVAVAADSGASIFLINVDVAAEDEPSLVSELPPKSLWVAEIAAMQSKNMEIDQSRAMKAQGCKAMLVSGACVGDDEDLAYSRWVVAEMASKASSEFKITGMTGHVNGHYGTGTFEKSSSGTMWKRGGDGS